MEEKQQGHACRGPCVSSVVGGAVFFFPFVPLFFLPANSIKAQPQSKHASPSRDGAAEMTDMASLVWLRKSHHYCLSLLKQQESNMRGWQA